ncbi:MAG: hypothetical protein H0U88_04455 [Chthoniobacterales bacterium]|nr:hypothetical protein [Chthoniobacterales bacterium]
MRRVDTSMLTAEELRLLTRKRRLIALVLVLMIVLGVGGYFAARPARDAIKGWQARRHAQKAFAFIEEERWKEAKDEAIAAYQLRTTEPEALRAVARFLSRTRQPQALEFWKQLEERASLNRTDLRDQAAVALTVNESSRAEEAIGKLLSSTEPAPDPADWLLAAQAAAQKGSAKEAAPYLEKILADPAASERQQLQAALIGLGIAAQDKSTTADSRRVATWTRILQLSQGTSSTSLDALLVLAQRSLSQAGTPGATETVLSSGDAVPVEESGDAKSTLPQFPSADQVAATLDHHPLAKAQHKLLASDLQLHADSSRREELLARAIADWKDSDASGLAALATWLNGKGEHERQLNTIPLERAVQSRDLFLQHLDALGALSRWDEIKRLLDSERYPLDPMIQSMYLARCNAQLGQRAASENNWQRALEAAGGDVSKLMTLAPYAEKNGAAEVANAAYTAATAHAPFLRPAQQGRLRMAQASRDTRKIHGVLAEMLSLWPNDSAVQNDEAYFRLLLLEPNVTDASELNQIRELAEDLVNREPASLPHRTLLALALLRDQRPAGALEVYSGIQVAANALTASALAIHAAALAANGKTEDAKTEAAQVPLDALLAEERILIQELLP